VGYQDEYATWVEIDLKAIENNISLVRTSTNVQVMAILKANGYGHGALQVARAAIKGGATWLGVARIEEALQLRKENLLNPILLLGHIPISKIQEALVNQISLTVWTKEQVTQVNRVAKQTGLQAFVHLKIDTGMSRIGVQWEDTQQLLTAIQRFPFIVLQGIFTHFARADERDHAPTDEQENRFLETLLENRSRFNSSVLVHAANSAASITRPSATFHMVRLGLAMYGLQPSPECKLPEQFKPALAWKTCLSHVKCLGPGRGISYGQKYVTKTDELIGTIPIGYADGFRRTRVNNVLVRGQRVPVVGVVCMDQSMLQLDRVPESQVGDEVVIIGYQAGMHLSAEEVAQNWNTINYEVVCGIGARVPRLYVT
jgi:alanine racemase